MIPTNTTPTHSPPLPDATGASLDDLLVVEEAKRDEALAAQQAEYRQILARAAEPLPADGNRLRHLAGVLGIDPATAKRDAAQATEAGRHRREVARLKSETDVARADLAKAKAEHEHHAAALAAAKSPAGLLAAMEAGVVAVHRDNRIGCSLPPRPGVAAPADDGMERPDEPAEPRRQKHREGSSTRSRHQADRRRHG